MRQSILAFGLVVPVVWPADALAVNCAPFTRTFHGQTVDMPMTVRSGKTCSITFRSSGPTETTHIVARPSHGSASIGSVGKVTYRANSGYVGSDTFTYARRGRDTRDNPSDRQVRVLVTVNP